MNVLSLYPAPSLVCWLTASFSPHHTHHSPSAPTRLHPPGVPPPTLLPRLTTEIKTTPKWLSLSGVFPRPHCPVTCTRLGMRHVPEDIGLGDISKNEFVEHSLGARWHSGKGSAYHCRRHKRFRFNVWVGKIPWRRKWQPTPVEIPWTEEPGTESVHGVARSPARLSIPASRDARPFPAPFMCIMLLIFTLPLKR